MQNMTFCEECRKDVAYTVKTERMSGIIRGVEYEYDGKTALCSECGHEVFVPELHDSNLETLYSVYRATNGIISLAAVRGLPTRYNIGKRPLSTLLGFGEQTFTRYINGDVPSAKNSELLLKIYNEPAFYLELLEEGKDRITPLAYEKSKSAAQKLLDELAACDNKTELLADYLIYKSKDITHLMLQKALYYIQGFYYAFYQQFVFSDDCEAWVHGPVYRKIYNKYRAYGYAAIESQEPFDESKLTDAEKSIADSVIEHICCYSGGILESFTHSEMPWLRTRRDLPHAYASDRVISKELISEYFNEVKRHYNMINPSDIKAYALDMFMKKYDK